MDGHPPIPTELGFGTACKLEVGLGGVSTVWFGCAKWGGLMGLALLAGCGTRHYHITGDPAQPFIDPQPCPTDKVGASDLDARIATIKSKFGIDVQYRDLTNTRYYTVKAITEPGYSALNFYLGHLETELGAYAPGILPLGEIRRIGFVHDAKLQGMAVSGLASYAESLILFNFPSDVCDPLWTVGTIHHEVLHMLQINSATNFLPAEGWVALNDWPFYYQDERKVSGGHVHPPGFVTDYAMKNAFEDSAETFAALMTSKAATLLAGWLPNDHVLTAKVSFMKNRFQTLNPTFNQAFWEKRRLGTAP